jgi:fructokinase
MEVFGGIETGGTKFVCIVASDPDHVIAECRIATKAPEETIHQVRDFFTPFIENGNLKAIGIAAFGPLDLNQDSPTYGYITTTPKPGWMNIDLLGEIKNELKIPIVFETDVNAAAFGEQYWRKENRQLDPFLYMTVGTGIGVGVIINGAPLHGLMHAEAGHSTIPHNLEKDPFPGICPFHGDCLEGLASGQSMFKRWGQVPESLPNDHPAWEIEADYLALALVNLIYAYSPKKIILGGGVFQHPGLIQSVREKVQAINNGYFQSNRISDQIEDYIQPPFLGNRSGALGAIAMAINLVNP